MANALFSSQKIIRNPFEFQPYVNRVQLSFGGNMKSRNITGLILILLGVGFLLDRFNVIPFGDVVQSWWPIIFVAMGVVQIINRPNKLTGSLFLIALGGLLIADNLFNIDFWSTALPLGLIIWGIGFLIRDKDGSGTIQVKHNFTLGGKSNTTELEDEVIDVSAVFSGSSHRINSQKFRGGKVTSTFGGVELDLRNASMASNEASLDVDVSFGGCEIKVPQSWHVIIQGTPIFGGVENDTLQRAIGGEQVSTLTVRTTVLFGGLEIKN